LRIDSFLLYSKYCVPVNIIIRIRANALCVGQHYFIASTKGGLKKMTYNFDPDQWYQNEIDALKRLHQSGELGHSEFIEALSALEKHYDRMVERLDGTYRI